MVLPRTSVRGLKRSFQNYWKFLGKRLTTVMLTIRHVWHYSPNSENSLQTIEDLASGLDTQIPTKPFLKIGKMC